MVFSSNFAAECWSCGIFGTLKREAQGIHGDVPGGVKVAGLEGHRSRFAVYLVHLEGLGQALRR
jgi:hypothetical protein